MTMILGDEFRARRYRNGGMQLATWIVAAVLCLVSFVGGALWAGW